MESLDRMNFIVGPSKSGKSTFCHLMTGSNLSIEYKFRSYYINSIDNKDPNRQIGNEGIAETTLPQYYRNYIDFPGFGDNRGINYDLSTSLHIRNELKKFKYFRLVLFVEESKIMIGKGAEFTKLTEDFITMFKLSKAEAENVIIVVSKTDQSFLKELPEMLKNWCNLKSNIIIDAIKRKEIKVLAFENPQNVKNEFKINEMNITELKEGLNENKYFNCFEFSGRINDDIEDKLLSIKKYCEKYPEIAFSSKIDDIRNIPDSVSLLFIDSHKNLQAEFIKIHVPMIIVLFDKNEKFLWEIKGKNPKIIFSKKVKEVINGENLIISTKNILEKDFPNPTTKEFDRSCKFFRLESICVNGKWTEYASHNNKFIDLIVYLNPKFGSVEVNPLFKIKKITIDIQLKFFINECMRTKKGIKENFVSIRMCRDIEEYLDKCKKTNISPLIIDALLNFIVKLPSIFQIFMNSKYLSEFFKSDSNKNDLLKIKNILLKKYIMVIKHYITNKTIIPFEDEYYDACKKFNQYCHNHIETGFGKLSHKNDKFLEELILVLEKNGSGEASLNFFSFFDIISTTEYKIVLVDYSVTGDASKYPNIQCIFNNTVRALKDCKRYDSNSFNLGDSVLIAAGVSLGIGAIGGVVNFALARGAGVVAAEVGIGAGAIAFAAIGAGLTIFDISINLICTGVKSGYYDKIYTPDSNLLWALLSLDFNDLKRAFNN